ncbi:MAG: STAS domain-containing protein [Termitinemataceae bacterium]
MPEALYYQEENNCLYLKGEGHITAILCADLREVVFARLENPPAITEFYIDLSACDYMDSTFMGLLVGFNKRLVRSTGKRIKIVQPSAKVVELLEGLGVISLIDLVQEPVPFPETMININQTKQAGVDLLLHTHENLMEISEENKKKFSALHSVLKSQQDKNSSQ